ncbi:hypothetical protein DRQ25_15940 [Candidatus Fermentibacteria bacterium]|nr:MAG: hypothetical protein DRQ25_15940 [Candidatus Fermentibacteria bacterium]
MVMILFCIAFAAVPAGEGSLAVDLGGSPPLPALQELGIDSVLASDSSITVLQESILQWYLEEGYPFAGAGYYFVSGDTLRVNTVPGRHALLEEIRIEGAPGTRTEVFTRLMALEPGDIYDRSAVIAWIARIEQLKFIKAANVTELLLGEGGNIVIVQHIEKGRQGHFAASMDWRGENLEGAGEVLFLNLAGTARELEISGRTTEWGGFNAYIRYREPWLFGIPLSAQLEASQETPESSWVNREASLSVIWAIDRTEIMGGAGIWRGYPPDGERQKYDYGLGGIAFRAGHRMQQGWNGIEFQLQARSGNRTGQDSSGILTMADLSIDGNVYSGVMGFGGRLLTGGVMQGDWFEGLLQQLGGQETLRGYPENAFRAVRYAAARPEISLGETETRVYLFCDLAAIRTPEEGMRYPVGCGAGMRGISGIFNADAAAGFPLSEGLGSARFYLRLTASL